MRNKDEIERMRRKGRNRIKAVPGDASLGPLKHLPGTWENASGLSGRGWNMIALPFESAPFNYRLLVNQYNEKLKFSFVDDAIPNRGLPSTEEGSDGDQLLVALDYEQSISQIASADFPESGKAGAPGIDIHHEPGLWLHMLNENTNNIDIARLATIPHGDSVLALGASEIHDGAPSIPNVNGLPEGVPQNLESPYLSPYKHFNDNLFQGLFDPVNPAELLKRANEGVEIIRTTKLEVDTSVEDAGIVNIPFIVKQANASDMQSTFWIQELAESDEYGEPKLRLQYLQVIFLDFFSRRDGAPGLIRWPHVSINTMEKKPEKWGRKGLRLKKRE